VRRVTILIAAVLAPLVGAGCAVNREHQASCKPTAAVVGALIGGAAVGTAVGVGASDDAAGAGAGVGGAVLGGLVGYALGSHFCQLPEAPAPPPPSPSPPLVHKKIELRADSYFDFNKAKLKSEGERQLEGVVDELKANPTIRVLVEGHTDSIGSHAYNQRLSERRADAVRDYMVSHGIDPSRITTRGWGETKPVASNQTEEGRAQNRRVELTED
jgi:OOP family OmpA-OmpF porin